MGEHIWQWGCCFTAGELIQRITGSALDAKPFLRYLDRKYSALYGLAPEPENARVKTMRPPYKDGCLLRNREN